jgi:hypothetical protein
MNQGMESGSQQKPHRKLRRWGFGFALGLILLAIAYLCISWMIRAGVRSISEMALQEYPGDRVSALMAVVESEEHSMRDINRAIWALGQLGDPRALPVLEKHYIGKPSDERYEISQYELKKAIALCKGAINISALVWRHGALATR